VNQSTKQVALVKSFENTQPDTVNTDEWVIGFAADGNSFFTQVTKNDEANLLSWSIQQYDMSTLKATSLYDTKASTPNSTQDIVTGPNGAPVYYDRYSDGSPAPSVEDLGFFVVKNKGLERLTPGIALNFTDEISDPKILGGNDKLYVFGVSDKTTYHVYVYNLATKQATLTHNVETPSPGVQIGTLIGWVKS
jgi:hypothetical protein